MPPRDVLIVSCLFLMTGCLCSVHDTRESQDASQVVNSDALNSVVGEMRQEIRKLTSQIGQLSQQQWQDRDTIAELERQVKACQDDVIINNAENIQLKQHMKETQEKVVTLEELVYDQKLDIGRLDNDDKLVRVDMAKIKHQHEQVARSMKKLRRNITEEREDTEDSILSIIGVLTELKTQQEQHNKKQQEIQATALASNKKFEEYKLNVNHMIHMLINRTIEKITTFSIPENHVTADMDKTPSTTISNRIFPELSIQEGSGDGDEKFTEIEEEFNVVGENVQPDHTSSKSNNIATTPTIAATNGDSNVKQMNAINNAIDMLELKVEEMKLEISHLQQNFSSKEDQVERLGKKLTKVSKKYTNINERIKAIDFQSFIRRVHNAILHFTQNVITKDQWKMASQSIINSTQNNQQQIMNLTATIANVINEFSETRWRFGNLKSLTSQQYQVVRLFIIRLNNTVEDIKEDIRMGRLTSIVPVKSAVTSDLTKKMDDLSLQLIINENRISKMEINWLNNTLNNCVKSNLDLFQDSQLLKIERDMDNVQSSIDEIKESHRSLERSLFRVHTRSKNNTGIMGKLVSMIEMLNSYIPMLHSVKTDVENLLYQLPTDCDEHYQRGFRTSGIYVIHPKSSTRSQRVFCEMNRSGAWTVIQTRLDGSMNFSRGWSDYRRGFGKATSEYWLGNELLHLLTSNKRYSLQIDMTDYTNEVWVAKYKYFKVANENNRYRLSVKGYEGNNTDGFGYSHGMFFSTPDRDEDSSSTHCAKFYSSGWWYRHCQFCNLNGRWHIGVLWYHQGWKKWMQLKKTVMKIKPTS